MSITHIIYDGYFLTEDIAEQNEIKNVNFIKISLKKIGFFLKILRFFHFKTRINKKEIWYEKKIDKNKFNKEDKIILFDLCSYYYTDYICELCNNEIKLWIWNSIDEASKNFNIDKLFEKIPAQKIYTFDKRDAEKYGVQYLNQFYWRINKEIHNKEDKIFFVGYDKGRVDKLLEIKKILPDNICPYFFVFPDEKKQYNKEQAKFLISKKLQYSEVLKYIQESKYLLEINKENQTGLTLRTLEALYFETKLITNNLEIQEYDFYHSSNIFILQDNTSEEELKLFLQKEYVPISNDIKEKYYYTTWLEKILSEVN